MDHQGAGRVIIIQACFSARGGNAMLPALVVCGYPAQEISTAVISDFTVKVRKHTFHKLPK